MGIRNVGVVGCGQMGGGIVQVCAQAGYPVLVSEINDRLLEKGLAAVAASLERETARERLTPPEKDAALSRISGTTAAADFSGCDIVIEAAAENPEIKQGVFRELDAVCPAGTVLATNTSSLSVTDIGAATARPGKVLGLHFFNPVPAMKLLEIIATPQTSRETTETAVEFGRSLGKTVILAPDTPGFIVNRLMTPHILNAIRLVESGAASREDVDTGMTIGLNHPMGPLALADLIGLDTLLSIADNIYGRLREEQYAAPEILKRKVAAGELGRKTGRGFYVYN